MWSESQVCKAPSIYLIQSRYLVIDLYIIHNNKELFLCNQLPKDAFHVYVEKPCTVWSFGLFSVKPKLGRYLGVNSHFYLSVLTRNPSGMAAPQLTMTLPQPLCCSWETALLLLLPGGSLACVVWILLSSYWVYSVDYIFLTDPEGTYKKTVKFTT